MSDRFTTALIAALVGCALLYGARAATAFRDTLSPPRIETACVVVPYESFNRPRKHP